MRTSQNKATPILTEQLGEFYNKEAAFFTKNSKQFPLPKPAEEINFAFRK
jgi:hypothetical protein